MKPKVFVASSVEGLTLAYSLQTGLQYTANLTVWDQGVFSLSKTAMDSLTTALNSADFGIFVFSPDDEAVMRGNTITTVRDNVLFEMGLFVGRLGIGRCFIVMPDNADLHIPSDLLGFTPAKYSGERVQNQEETQAALGPAIHALRQEITKQGPVDASKPSEKSAVATDDDGYDDADREAILKSWLDNSLSAMNGTALKYTDIDEELSLNSSSTKNIIPTIIDNIDGCSLTSEGSKVFAFSYTRPPNFLFV